ncbi:hypothetical protein BDW62DRAFT_199274 [Aspergillus aurantiobrunneus]
MNPTRFLLSPSFSPPPPTKRSITPFTRRLFQLPAPPANPSPSHSDLPSFLSYANRTALSESTTTYQGTVYEYNVQSHLRTAAFNLHRVGGRSDLGIDLSGTWHVGPNPVFDPPVRVIVQCKALKTKIGPNIVRELEGVTARHFAPSAGAGAGVIVSPREATKGVREALGKSRMPLVWMMVGREGGMRQLLWNWRVEALGLGGLGVEVLYSGDFGEDRHTRVETRLMWEGKEVQTMDEIEEGMKQLEEEWMAKWEARGLRSLSGEEVLDAVERTVPGTRPILISEEEREAVVRSLLST